jgi:hypothetical protein
MRASIAEETIVLDLAPRVVFPALLTAPAHSERRRLHAPLLSPRRCWATPPRPSSRTSADGAYAATSAWSSHTATAGVSRGRRGSCTAAADVARAAARQGCGGGGA